MRLVESVEGGRSVIVAQGAGGAKRVLTSGPHAEQGSYSPDGRRIVYEQRSPEAPDDIRRSVIVVANPDGSAPRVVSPGTDPSWSPDGLLLLFKIWEPQKDELWIATAAADGAGLRQLAPGVHPHWSPDGRRIAYMRDGPGGRTDIWVMNADGGAPRCLTCPVSVRPPAKL